jgi:hypothetical protein
MSKRMARVPQLIIAACVGVATLAVGVAPVAAAPVPGAPPQVTFTLITGLPTELAVGETVTIHVRVESSEPFVMAIALSDAYYPGRGVRFDGSSAEARSTTADLYLTLTGRESTADLPAVQDWPVDEDWDAGVLPLVVRAGARFPGGVVVSTGYLFGVTVL